MAITEAETTEEIATTGSGAAANSVVSPGNDAAPASRYPRTFAALRHRNFRLFYIGQLISLIGSWMQNTAQGWLVVLLALPPGASLTQATGGAQANSPAEAQANLYLGMIAIAGSLPILFGSLYGGVIADRYSKRAIIVWAQSAQMLIALAMAGLIALGHIEIWHVIALAALIGVSNVFDIPARQSFVVEMVGRDDLPNAIALNSSIFNAARAFGPALAGLLIAAFRGRGEITSLAWCFGLNGVSYIAVLIGLFLMRGDFAPKNAGGPQATPLESVREVWAYLLDKRPALLLIVLVAAFSIFNAPYFVLLPSLARFTLHADAGRFGFLASCQGIGALAAALLIATLSEYNRKGLVLTAASLTFPVLLFLLSQTHTFWLGCVLVTGIGFAIIAFLATANTLLQTSVPDALRGRIMGVYSLILMGLAPIGSLWTGLVAKPFGAPVAIEVGAIAIGLVAVWVAIRYPCFRTAAQTLPATL